jgi:AraC-like DNA-binding protein
MDQMAGSAVLPLSGHSIIRTRDPEEVRAFLSSRGIGFGIAAKDARRLDACLNCIALPNLYISYVHYDAEVSVWTTEANCDFWVVPPIRGPFETVLGRHERVCIPGGAVVMSPRRGGLIRSSAGSARLSLRLLGPALIRHLSALLGEPIDAPLQLAPAMDLTHGYGRSIAGHLRQAIADAESGGSLLCDRAIARSFEEFVLTALLLSHPHSYSEPLRRLDRPAAPRDVKRAIDFIEARLDSVVTLADIVAASGVPGRTLFRHFKDRHGVSPMRYLRLARFRKVREALQQGGLDQDVAEVATRWGFEHMGRFAVEYRQRFGERPSDTLKSRSPRPAIGSR